MKLLADSYTSETLKFLTNILYFEVLKCTYQVHYFLLEQPCESSKTGVPLHFYGLGQPTRMIK